MLEKMFCVHLGDKVIVVCVHENGTSLFHLSRLGDIRKTIELDFPLEYIGIKLVILHSN